MNSKRNLTTDEINEMIKFINNDLIKTNIEKSLLKIKIYENKIPKLKNSIEKMYYKALVPPGEYVGINAALSNSSVVTQLVLNTFHASGVLNILTTSGVKRIEELMALSKNQKMSKSIIYFKNVKTNEKIETKKNDIKNLFKLAKTIEYTNINTYVTSFDIIKSIDYKMEWWNSDLANEYEFTNVLRLNIDKYKCKEYDITIQELVKIIENIKDDMLISNNNNTIDILFNLQHDNIKNYQDSIPEEIFIKHYYHDIIAVTDVSGISGILKTYFTYTENKDEWKIETQGSNFLHLLSHPSIDYVNTLCNNVWEIYNTLGIEATRTFLISEFKNILSGSAFVNDRHIALLVDTMCYSGIPKSVNRHGISGEPLAKMSFEECVKNAISSSIKGEIDNMKGVSSNIILGQPIKRNFELFLDTTKFDNNNNTNKDNTKLQNEINDILNNNKLSVINTNISSNKNETIDNTVNYEDTYNMYEDEEENNEEEKDEAIEEIEDDVYEF